MEKEMSAELLGAEPLCQMQECNTMYPEYW